MKEMIKRQNIPNEIPMVEISMGVTLDPLDDLLEAISGGGGTGVCCVLFRESLRGRRPTAGGVASVLQGPSKRPGTS